MRGDDEGRARSIAISLAEKENVDPTAFGDQLADILDDNGSPRWIDCKPSERVARAYREWQRKNSKKPEPTQNNGEKDKNLPFQSSGRSKTPNTSFLDELKASRKDDNFKSLLKKVASTQGA